MALQAIGRSARFGSWGGLWACTRRPAYPIPIPQAGRPFSGDSCPRKWPKTPRNPAKSALQRPNGAVAAKVLEGALVIDALIGQLEEDGAARQHHATGARPITALP